MLIQENNQRSGGVNTFLELSMCAFKTLDIFSLLPLVFYMFTTHAVRVRIPLTASLRASFFLCFIMIFF